MTKKTDRIENSEHFFPVRDDFFTDHHLVISTKKTKGKLISNNRLINNQFNHWFLVVNYSNRWRHFSAKFRFQIN